MGRIIRNRIYNIDYYVYKDYVFICNFRIENEYRGRGYSKRIFDRVIKKSNRNRIILECFPALLKFYMRLGFHIIGKTEDGYFEMEFKNEQPLLFGDLAEERKL